MLALSGCSGKPGPVAINQQAALSGQLPYNPLGWKVITSSVNQRQGTMSTLYGNDVAVAYARSKAGGSYPEGAVLALVTWGQREDPHWFGAMIPSQAQKVEFVSFGAAGAAPAYERYQGSPLARAAASEEDPARVQYVVSQRAAVMP